MIVKYVETSHNGIQSLSLSRYAIGYILRGEKYIYYGDKRHRLSRGDLFYLGMGHHYTEDIPEEGHPFEQIMFYYTPSELQRILLHLNITYGLNISNDHTCENCRSFNHVVTPAWNPVRSFFVHTNNYLRDEAFLRDETAENIKMTELIYLISSHEDCCIKSKLLSNIDTAKENFEQIVYDHIFRDISIEELSRLCNRSLTSFKKEFKRLFSLPPHKWYIRQRIDALPSAADLHVEVHLRNRGRMYLPQHVAFHQAVQEGVRPHAGHLPQPPPRSGTQVVRPAAHHRTGAACRRTARRSGRGGIGGFRKNL